MTNAFSQIYFDRTLMMSLSRFYSLITDDTVSDPARQKVIRAALWVGLFLTTAYGTVSLLHSEPFAASMNALCGLALISGILVLRVKRWSLSVSVFCVILSMPLFIYDVYRGNPDRFDLLWSLILPVFVILLMGRKAGILFLALYWIAEILLLFLGPSRLTLDFKFSFLTLFAVITFSLWLYETFRINALNRQRESEKAFRDFVDHLPQMIFEFDEKGYFSYVNDPALKTFGYSREEAQKGILAIQMFSPEDREKAASSIKARLCGSTMQNHEYMAIRKDGTRFPVLVHSNPVIKDGKTVGLRGIVIDISELQRAHAEKEALREQLHQIEKLDAIGKLAGGIAHDFNNQLAGIIGFADLIVLATEKNNPDLTEYAERIKRISHRASDLTSQLLAFARKGKYLSVAVDMHNLINDTCLILERSIDKRIQIRRNLKSDCHSIQGDPSQLQSMLLNLAINSRDALAEGGLITISTETILLEEQNPILIRHASPTGRYFSLSISDTGAGMTEEIQRRMFEPFFTTKAPGKGTGIGLAAVYGTVLGHHGCIDVKSAPGMGTAITIYFPLTAPNIESNEISPPQLDPISPPQTVPVKKTEPCQGRILVVDDEEPVRDMLKALLENLGCRVHTEVDGYAAEAWFKNHWQETDAVLLDLMMPGLSGRAVWERLKIIQPEVKVLLISGYSMQGEAQALLAHGVQGFLQKPFDSKTLEAALGKILSVR